MSLRLHHSMKWHDSDSDRFQQLWREFISSQTQSRSKRATLIVSSLKMYKSWKQTESVRIWERSVLSEVSWQLEGWQDLGNFRDYGGWDSLWPEKFQKASEPLSIKVLWPHPSRTFFTVPPFQHAMIPNTQFCLSLFIYFSHLLKRIWDEKLFEIMCSCT